MLHDETWIHWYTLETKQQSKLDFSRRICSEEGKDGPIGRKGDGHRFLGFTRCDLHRLPGEGQNDHRILLCRIIGPVWRRIAEKRPHSSKKKVLFHHDNAPAHTSAVATAKLFELGYELLPHQPYSPDLAPCDFFLLQNLKKSLAGQKFESNDEVIAATEAYFADLQKTYFSDGLKKLEHHWVKCIELKGDYVEK